MKNDIFFEKEIFVLNLSHHGLVGIMRYDPHVPRCFEGIKLNLLQSRPTIIRVHHAGNYPTNEYSSIIDQEGQAILIIGYDEDRKAFAAIDPYDRNYRHPSITWILYEHLALTMVDMTLGTDLEAPGLELGARISNDKRCLDIFAGLPNIYGTIIDHENLILTNLMVNVNLRSSNRTYSFHQKTKKIFNIGSQENFLFYLSDDIKGTVFASVSVNGYIKNTRPYNYQDKIGADIDFQFSAATQPALTR